jgi:hypothetical protein
MRFALGLEPVIGIRIPAERLPYEYTPATGSSSPRQGKRNAGSLRPRPPSGRRASSRTVGPPPRKALRAWLPSHVDGNWRLDPTLPTGSPIGKVEAQRGQTGVVQHKGEPRKEGLFHSGSGPVGMITTVAGSAGWANIAEVTASPIGWETVRTARHVNHFEGASEETAGVRRARRFRTWPYREHQPYVEPRRRDTYQDRHFTIHRTDRRYRGCLRVGFRGVSAAETGTSRRTN